MILAVINKVIWEANEDLHTLKENKMGIAVAARLTNNPHYLQGAVCKDGGDESPDLTGREPHVMLRAILDDEVASGFGLLMSDKIRKGFSFTYTWDYIKNGRVNWKPICGGTTVSLFDSI